VKIILLNENYNKNETKAHYELKQIAKYILHSRGYKQIATEVCIGMDITQYLKNYNFKPSALRKNIIDTIGLKTNNISLRKPNYSKIKVMGIEAKASLSDYKNGFCTNCEYLYIITPKGIIPKEKIPKNIGLIEVDLDNYKIKQGRSGFEFTGIETVIQAKSRKKELYKGEQTFSVKMFNVLRSIAYRSTVNDLFKNNEIEVNFW
jgi:hypothetical protein